MVIVSAARPAYPGADHFRRQWHDFLGAGPEAGRESCKGNEMPDAPQPFDAFPGERVTVNIAAWEGPAFPPGWIIVNAPRPLVGERTWTSDFRHGVFYAAGPYQAPGDDLEREIAQGKLRSWVADDAWQVVFTDDAEIKRRVLAKFAEYGFEDEAAAGVTIAEQAACMGLPWHGAGGQ